MPLEPPTCPSGPDVYVHLRYRSREITTADLEFLRAQCSSTTTRGELVKAVCEAWQWRQVSVGWSLYACTDLLLRLEERGLLKLPPPAGPRRLRDRRPFAQLPLPPDLIVLSGLEVRDPSADLRSLCVRPIASEERVGWRLYVERYHDLGDRPIVGEHLLYAAFLDDERVALLGWASAALRAPLREQYIGWDEATKRRRLHLVANNIQFVILRPCRDKSPKRWAAPRSTAWAGAYLARIPARHLKPLISSD